MIPAFFVGIWDENNDGDKEIISELVPGGYDDWISKIRTITKDSHGLFFRKKDHVWRICSLPLVWSLISESVTREQFQTYQEIALKVLGEIDPQYDLPDGRVFASLYGKIPKYSKHLKTGIATSLALLGSCSVPNQVSYNPCSERYIVRTIVDKLLDSNDWKIWAGLNPVLPLLAEAAPTTFLEKLEDKLDMTPSLIEVLHKNESTGTFKEQYTTGILWGLELLIRCPEHIIRVVDLLGKFLEIEGKPYSEEKHAFRSLKYGLNARYPQPTVTSEKYSAALKKLLTEHSEIGVAFLLEQISFQNTSFFPISEPIWNETLIANFSEEDKRMSLCIDFVMEYVKQDTEKLLEILSNYRWLNGQMRYHLCDYLKHLDISLFSEDMQYSLWEIISEKIRFMKRCTSKNDIYHPDEIQIFQDISDLLVSDDPCLKYQYMFDEDYPHPIYDPLFEASQDQLSEHKSAIQEIFSKDGLEGVLRFLENVSIPFEVGLLFSTINGCTFDERNLRSYMQNTSSEKQKKFITGYIRGKFQTLGWSWVDSLHPNERLNVLLNLPQSPETWERIQPIDEKEYWESVQPYAVPMKDQNAVSHILSKYIQYNLPEKAVVCIFCALLHEGIDVDSDQILQVLEQHPQPSDYDHFQKILQYLADQDSLDPDRVLLLEIGYYSIISHSSKKYITVFEKKIAASPDFFCEVIEHVFGNNKIADAENSRNLSVLSQFLCSCKVVPGDKLDGTFNEQKFSTWYEKVLERCTKSGLSEQALSVLGSLLFWTPPDPNGLWIHRHIAKLLNERTNNILRDGFHSAVINNDGVHFWDGTWEDKRNSETLERADALDNEGFCIFASCMRGVAEEYLNDKERHEEIMDRYE